LQGLELVFKGGQVGRDDFFETVFRRTFMIRIALLGAGGKMGLRITDNLLKSPYSVRHVEISPAGRTALAERGLTAAPAEEHCQTAMWLSWRC